MNVSPILGWLGLLFMAFAFDSLNQRDLSTLAQHHRLATALIAIVVVAHLLALAPARLDPFEWLARLIGKSSIDAQR